MHASFLISLYCPDANSAVALQTMRVSSGELYVTVFGELEVVNALHLRVFRKELSGSQVQASLSDFEKDSFRGHVGVNENLLMLQPFRC